MKKDKNGFGDLLPYKGNPAACRGWYGRKRKEENPKVNSPYPVPSAPLLCDSCKHNMNECDADHEVVCAKMGAALAFGVAECISYEEN